ncbi:8-oxo-dGTP diphosphatase MutT [Prochlorococcus sp. MIT 0916]|uniref:Adenine DNA glycosylase n=1 Tax=Prochlorococcus marinus str. P0903-H212 TaxID=1622208 RepID=A0A0D5A3R6_PROMR|nr:A/G-specific adenine glycosylase [Prochlorococcus marinus str. P0903-H212]
MIKNNLIIGLQKDLLNWFDDYGRHWIPWKLNSDGLPPENGEIISPYGIWIAEIMLQQTQLNVVLPYWEKWMKTFPLLNNLVDSNEHNILMHWRGLGFYSRAMRIQKSSKLLIEHIGKDNTLDPLSWPTDLNSWIVLPGVGKSTAGSIISSAFDKPFPILDGNVKRILSRLIASEKTLDKDQNRLWKLSKQLLPLYRARDFNQALMDLGATVCTLKKPKCLYCPLQQYCLAYINYDPIDFPKKKMKKIIPIEKIGIALVFNSNGDLIIDQRLESSSMGGMWEFPGGKKESNESIEDTIKREVREELGIEVQVGNQLLSFDHSYSHRKLQFEVYLCKLKSGNPKPLASQKILWVAPIRLLDFPFPSANSKIISALLEYLGIECERL